MSSSNQLQLCLQAKGSLSNIKGTWLKHNATTGNQVHVRYNVNKNYASYQSICISRDKKGWCTHPSLCNAHLKCDGKDRTEMEITSLCLEHTCGTDGCGKIQRKRNYKMADIRDVNDVLGDYQPTKKREGNAKQFATFTRRVTGIEVKACQASKAIRALSNDTIEAQIGQYMMIPSLFEAFNASDTGGTYILEKKPCTWNPDLQQFKRCYVATSMAKTFWAEAGTKMIICDGTHTKSTGFKHVILLAVTFDGNNQVQVLAFAVVDSENGPNWVWFKERLEEDFPGVNVWM